MPTLLERRAIRDSVIPTMMPVALPSGEAQRAWAALPVGKKLRVMKQARHQLAAQVDEFCAAIPKDLARNAADTICAEMLPLLDAFKFLEREAETILRARPIGTQGRPLWLVGVLSEVQRVPLGRVLVIAPSNYPLFLAGVQVAQALVAGNAVIWKPGLGGLEVALLFAKVMQSAGLPDGLLTVTDDSLEAAKSAINAGVDKVFFTGSAASGKALLKHLAESLTPCVAELSGCDAVFVLPSADLLRVVRALAFGMRLNGSATCMAPRRIIFVGSDSARRNNFVASLLSELALIKGIPLPLRVERELRCLVEEATEDEAQVHGELNDLQQPLLVTDVTPSMRLTQADIFAPLLMLQDAESMDEAIASNEACPYALTAAIFGNEREALRLAGQLTAGTVTVNDLMVPAADPRTPFGGRKSSGFGVTQGAEGLLEMTAPKTIAVRRGSGTNHYEATTPKHARLFKSIIAATHRAGWRERMAGIRELLSAASDLKEKK